MNPSAETRNHVPGNDRAATLSDQDNETALRQIPPESTLVRIMYIMLNWMGFILSPWLDDPLLIARSVFAARTILLF